VSGRDPEPMPRSIWNGTITFGLTVLPIKVHSATEDKSVRFHQVHAPDGARIRQKRICSKEGQEVPYKQVARGYELRGGKYVLLTQEEIDAAAGGRSRLIELEEFVRAEEIDPVYYDRTYYLGAGDDGEDAYRLVHDALARAQRVGIGRWVFHNREYLVAIRPLEDLLALHTMRFADELVSAADLDISKPSRAPTKPEIEMAGELVESLHERFHPETFADSYRDRVLELIEAKASGRDPDLPEVDEEQDQPDLFKALEASLGSSARRSSANRSSGNRSSGKGSSGNRSSGKQSSGGSSGKRSSGKRSSGKRSSGRSRSKARS
jgi:DNA end-binding protein Ku